MEKGMDLLHSEKITAKKKEVELRLVGNMDEITRKVKGFEEELENMKTDPEAHEEYSHSEYDDNRTQEEVIKLCTEDVDNLSAIFGGSSSSLQLFLNKQIEKELGLSIVDSKSELVLNWPDIFKKIGTKADGTFAKGRVVTLYSCSGFSWEDSEAYGRRGYELIIKNIDDTTAELQLRTGMVEKW